MILVDVNIMMYAAGLPHKFKKPSARLLERVATGECDAAIDAEALQEILHRYRAIRRWEDGRRVFDLTRQIFSTVIPITAQVLDDARRLLDAIYSYDRNFDGIPGVRRLEPEA